MSGHTPWREIRHKSADPERAADYRREFERTYNRPWWRLVRLFDRARARAGEAAGGLHR